LNVRAPAIPGFTVRPLAPSDANAWAAYACLPEVKQHTSSTASSAADLLAAIERSLSGAPDAPVLFALVPDGATQMIGAVGFHSISALNRTAEITYDLSPSYWGRGIATTACRAATAWGFAARGWHRIQATTLLSNVASQRVLAKCGFQREGMVRNFRIVRGQPADYILFSAIPTEVTPPCSII